jgi:hypothetical protein
MERANANMHPSISFPLSGGELSSESTFFITPNYRCLYMFFSFSYSSMLPIVQNTSHVQQISIKSIQVLQIMPGYKIELKNQSENVFIAQQYLLILYFKTRVLY